MSKKYVDRSVPFDEKAECSICGAKVALNDEAMQLHVLARHPLEFLSHPAVVRRVASAAFDLGGKLAERLTHGKA